MVARSETKQRRRGLGRPFAKGQSGNPKGLPEWVREIREACALKSPEALAKVVYLMANATEEKVQLAAATAILDRAGAKPYSLEPAKIEVTGADGAPLVPGPDHARIDAALATVAIIEAELRRARGETRGGAGDAVASADPAESAGSDSSTG
jgi:hypothetical protein